MNRLQEKFNAEVQPALVKEFNISNPMLAPKIEKIDISVGAGGEGKDTYILGSTSNQNSYATITETASDLSGDVIVFADTSVNNTNTIAGFNAAKIDLGTTAVFDSLVNEAAKGSTADHKVSYFTFTDTVAGTTDTYLVQNNSANTTFDARFLSF